MRVFKLDAIIKCNVKESTVLRDINFVLSTIPASNKVTNLSFGFTISGKHPFRGCLEEDWDGMWDQVVRISAGKLLGLGLEMSVQMQMSNLQLEYPGEDKLYRRMEKRILSSSDHPNICTHLWYPINDGTGSVRRQQTCSRCATCLADKNRG